MSIKDRAELCIEVEGGYFEQYQQGKDQNNNEVIWTSGESGDESAWKSSKNLTFEFVNKIFRFFFISKYIFPEISESVVQFDPSL